MSTGGIFKLSTNVGVQDKLLMATDYLQARIRTITAKNKNIQNSQDTNWISDNSYAPDINEIEKSHVTFINGTYKPFITSGFEYNKVHATGLVAFGSDVNFNIPQFGEFFNDMVVHIRLNNLSSVDSRDRVRYVSLLGHKLLPKVSFKINGNILDSYTTDDYNAYYQFHVQSDKKDGWLRNVGQEIPNLAHMTSDPTFDFHREYKWYGNGNQTFKQTHSSIDLWIPILFWFKKLENSVPNCIIPHGQTNLEVSLANIGDIVGFADYGGGGAYNTPSIDVCELYVNNIFLHKDVYSIFIKKFGFSLIRVHGHHKVSVTKSDDSILLNNLKWPIETLYIAFRPRSNLSLSQHWHKSSALTLNTVKVPVVAKNIATTTSGYIISANSNTTVIGYTSGPIISSTDAAYNGYDFVITGGTGYNKDDDLQNRYVVSNYIGVSNTISVTGGWNIVNPDTSTTFIMFTPEVAINVANFYTETPSVNKLELRAHDITIFQESEGSFYNSYLPYRFGKTMNTPEDPGWYMMNFNFYTGEHQPSGHINVSRAREFYLKYTSTYINSSNKTDLVVLSDAINFLLIRDGSAILRYAT
jgi:hypothetical protein